MLRWAVVELFMSSYARDAWIARRYHTKGGLGAHNTAVGQLKSHTTKSGGTPYLQGI